MRIAVNTRFLLPNKLEGIGRFTLEVLRRMVKSHPEHDFYFFFDRKFDPSFIPEVTSGQALSENVTPVVLSPPARHPFLFYIWFEWSVARALKKYEIDVFLSTDNFCSLNTKVPTVLVTHDLAFAHFPEQVTYLQRKYYQYFTPRFLAKAEKIVAVSDYTKSDIIDKYGISERKIKVACNGCDERFKPISEREKKEMKNRFSDGADYFVYVGAIHPRKNVHRLIRAFYQLKETTQADCKLVIVGRKGWMIEEVQEALDSSPYKKDVIFTGYVEHEDLPRLIGASMAMVYVSLFEGFGIPILEAMNVEVPVITSNISSMPQVGGDAVLYVEPTDIQSITNQMIAILKEPDLRQMLIQKGRAQREKFSWERAAEVVYQAIIESHAS